MSPFARSRVEDEYVQPVGVLMVCDDERSYAPTSQPEPCGRVIPIWSVPLHPDQKLRAILPARSGIVFVAFPRYENVPSLRSAKVATAEFVAGDAGYDVVTLGHEVPVTRLPRLPLTVCWLLQMGIMLALL